jgi:hypothetical protein
MTKAEAQKIAEFFFKTYPSIPAFHITTDKQAFASINDANAHADFLNKKNPEVFTIEREKATTDVAPTQDDNTEDAGKPAAAKNKSSKKETDQK